MERTTRPDPVRTESERLLIRVAAAARLLSISRSTAYSLARDGRLPGLVRLGGSLRVSRTGLEDWIERAQHAAAAGRDDEAPR